MKKLYTKWLAAGVLALSSALSASAIDWYLVGSEFGWDDNATYKFEPTGNANEYTLTVPVLSGKIKIKQAGTWNMSIGQRDNKQLEEGVLYSAYCGNNAGDLQVNGIIQNAKITISGADGSAMYPNILAEGQSAENTYETVYIVGDINGAGWKEDITTYPLTSTDSKKWTGEITITLASYVKLKAGVNVYGVNGSDQTIESGTSYTAYNPSDKAFYFNPGQYSIVFDLEKNADTGTLTATSTGTVDPVYPKSLYVIGQVEGGDWDPSKGITLSTTDDGKTWTGTGTVTGSYFSFAEKLGTDSKDWDTVNGALRYSPTGGDVAVTPDVEATLYVGTGSSAYTVTSGTYDFSVDIEKMTFTLTEATTPLPANLYVIGSSEDTWDITKSLVDMSNDGDGFYSCENAELPGYGTYYFRFTDALSTDGDWDTYTATQYGSADGDGTPVEIEEEMSMSLGTNCWTIPGGVYTIYVDLNEMILVVEGTPNVKPEPAVITIKEDATPDTQGLYEGTINVTITTDGDNDKVYYTLDGTEPTAEDGTLYTAPIAISTDTTLKVLAQREDADDATATKEYKFATTGIGAIVDDAVVEGEVYDLSGRQVKADTLKPGMYIIRRGGEAQKVLVK